MVATIQFIKNNFDRFNKLCFDGLLPDVKIQISTARRFLGRCEFKYKNDAYGNIISHCDFVIKITDKDLPVILLEDVIIHEMIHYYIAYFNITDTSVHGKVFLKMMAMINTRFHRKIVVSHMQNSSGEMINAGPKSFYICVSTLDNGFKGITVCAKTRLFELHRALPQCYRLSNMEWYYTRNMFFDRFPRSNSAVIYEITAEELDLNLRGAIHMGFEGNTFKRIETEDDYDM